MRRFFAQLADVRPGEGQVLLETTLTLFFVVAGHTLAETARDALFLRELPASRLTLVYVVLAALAVLVSRWSAKVAYTFGRRMALLLTLLVGAYGNVVFYLLPAGHGRVFALYVFAGLVSSVAVAQFWTLVNDWYTVAQGRRLFGLVSAGGVLGAVGGASLAMGALNWFAVESLLLCAGGCYLLASAVVTLVGNQDESFRPLRSLSEPGLTFREAVRLSRSHPYVLRLAGLIALSTAAFLVTDYLFKSAAAAAFAPSELGEFFARFYAMLNTLALVAQLLASGYLIRRFGVLMSFLVLPALLFGGAGAVLLLGAPLVLVLLTKAGDGSLRHSLHRVTLELLWMPLPATVRGASKTFVDTVIARAAQALAAGALLLMATLNLDGPTQLAALLAGLLLLWLLVGARLRRPYLALFRDALGGRRTEQPYTLDLDTVEHVVQALSSRDASKAIAAMDLLESNGRSSLIPALVLYHESADVLVAALGIIATPAREDWIPLARRLLGHEMVDVRVSAMKALASVGIQDAVEERLYDIRPEVRGHAAFLVVQRSTVADALAHEATTELLALPGDAGKHAKLGLLSSIESAARLPAIQTPAGRTRRLGPAGVAGVRLGLATRFGSLLLRLAADSDDEVVQAAALAMARIRDPRFVPLLLGRVGIRRGREAVQEALTAQGEFALNQLADLLQTPSTPVRVRRHIPGTIALFGSQRASDILCRQLAVELDGLVRYKILKGLGQLVEQYDVTVDRWVVERQLERALSEHLRLAALALQLVVDAPRAGSVAAPSAADPAAGTTTKLLLQLLQDKATQALGRAFRLLQLINPNEEVRHIQAAMRSGDRRMRAHALEYIDTLTVGLNDVRTRQLFSVIIDDLPLEEGLRRVAQHIAPLPNDPAAALSMLLEDEDGTLATIAAYHALEQDIADQQQLIDAVAQVAQRPGVSLLDRELIATFTSKLRPVHVS